MLEFIDRLEEHLWPEGPRRDVWMIVDTARDRAAYRVLLDGFYTEHHCLYSGTLSGELRVAAPYLVPLEQGDAATRKLLRKAWGNGWGVLLVCNEPLAALRRHLRTLLVVQDEMGQRMMFRYYDPRVLRVYLPSCTASELQTVFGPIERILLEGHSADVLLDFSLDRGRLVSEKRLLTAAVTERSLSVSTAG